MQKTWKSANNQYKAISYTKQWPYKSIISVVQSVQKLLSSQKKQFIAKLFIVSEDQYNLSTQSFAKYQSHTKQNCNKQMNRFRLNNQLSLINEQEDEDLNLTERMAKFETSPDMKQKGIEQQKICSKSTGLDRFMTFLDQPQHSSNKKLKPLPNTNKKTVADQLNPQNTARPRPRSSLQRSALNKFTQFLQSQDLAMQKKQKTKKSKKGNGLSKFMETLCVAESIQQEKKLSNIVSGILAMSQKLPERSGNKQKYRYLINSQKFSDIRPKSKETKVRSHSANLGTRKSKELRKQTIIEQTKATKTLVHKQLLLSKEQISEKAFERKVKFFESIGDGKSQRLKHPEKDNFAFLN